MRVRHNPRLPEGINASQEHPLVEFLLLVAGVLLVIALLAAVLAYSAQWLAPKVPFAWELQLVDKVGEGLTPAADADADDLALREAELALQALGQRLISSHQGAADIRFSFHLLQEELPNAFATLGGHIFVTTGLLQAIDSENGLAMVMAHEMAHIERRHPIQALSRGVLLQLLLAMMGADTMAVQSLMTQAGVLTLLSFNRDMEREADQDALQLMLRHYGHLQGADEFFATMAASQQREHWQHFFETHPGVVERVAAITASTRLAESAGAVNAVTALDQRLLAFKQRDD